VRPGALYVIVYSERVRDSRLDQAIALIDAANADDPHRLLVRGVLRPKEQAHAELMTEWVLRLRPDASEELQLAARAHHIRRWQLPRANYPAGRQGYLEWKTELRRRHAADLRAILTTAGYPEPSIARACAILQKHGLTRDLEVRTLEDALCLVFLETQFEETAVRLDRPKMINALRMSISKMSEQGREAAVALVLPEHLREMLLEAARVG
jgi:hypothetical protein